MAQVASDALDPVVHGVFSAAQGAHGAGGGDSPGRQRGERAMRDTAAALARARSVARAAPHGLAARAVGRSARHRARARPRRRMAGARRPVACRPAAVGVRGGRRRGARPWRGAPTPRARGSVCVAVSAAPAHVAPIASPRASAPACGRRRAPENEAPATIAPAARRAAGASRARRARRRSVRRTRSCSCLRAARQDVTRGDFARRAGRHRGTRPKVPERRPGRRARSLARQVAGGARASRRSAARGGPVPRPVPAQRVPLDLRTHEGDGPLTTRGWLSALSAAAALLIAACEGGNIDAGRDLPTGSLPVDERNPVIVVERLGDRQLDRRIRDAARQLGRTAARRHHRQPEPVLAGPRGERRQLEPDGRGRARERPAQHSGRDGQRGRPAGAARRRQDRIDDAEHVGRARS